MAIEANLGNGTESPELARIGSTLENRYRILDVLAQGGMGVVYRGERLGLNRPVAVKFLHANFAADVKVRERFERELHAMSRLNHPNCVSVIDYGIADSPFIVMEYVTGRTLRHVIVEKGRLPPVRALFIASQILAALAHAHSQDMVHRDIKPGNIIVSDVEGTLDHVYVLDFGLAKFLSSTNDDLTQSWMLMGTPSYMAPEQARVGIVGAATDIYSTGVVLFELLTGTKPYVANHPLDIIHLHQTAAVPSIRERVPDAGFSVELDLALQTAMAKDPLDRFASAGAFARALDQVPEAASVRTSTKLRALTPPPGFDRPESLQLEALLDDEATHDPPSPVDAMPVATPAGAHALEPLQVRPQGSAPDIQVPDADARPVKAPSTLSGLSTLVPGVLLPRTTARVTAASPRRQETPLAMASTPLIEATLGGLRARSRRAWVVLASMSLTMIGLVSWYAAQGDADTAGTALQQQLHDTALVAPKPAELEPAASAEPGAELEPAASAEPAAELEPAASAEPAADPGTEPTVDLGVGAAGAPEQAQPAVQELAAAQPAAAAAPDEPAQAPTAAHTAVAIQAAAARPEPAASAPARAQPPARQGPVDSIADVERLVQQGRRDDAIQGILRLRRTNFPRSGYLAYLLGNLYFEKMEWSNGLAAYGDALRLKPEYRGNATLNENAIRALSHNQTWRKVNALYVGHIRQAGAKYLREAAKSSKNATVRQRAKQILGRVARK